MRESRQSSVISASEKLKYPRCDRKKEHGKESLNFVCLSANCKLKGLICVQCKSSGDHSGHNIQPLRSFLTKLQQSLKKSQLQRGSKMEQNPSTIINNERSMLQKLEQQHMQMLGLLKLHIEEVVERVRNCEEQIMKEFNRTKQKIYTEFEKETIINKTLAEVQRYFTEIQVGEQIDLKFNISKLISLLKVEKQEFTVMNQAEMQLNSYILAAKTFKNNLLVWERETTNIIGDILKSKPEYQVKEVQIRPTTAVDPSSKAPSLAFSSQFKTDSIVLEKDCRIAKVKDDKNGKVVLINHAAIETKSGPIRFKALSLSAASAVQIGVCLKAQVAQKSYKFQKSNPSHGFFLVSSNNFLYSSADPTVNNSKGGITFKTGDEILVQLQPKQSKLIVKKKNENKSAEISLKHLSEADWKELYYCISLGSTGDKVQLLG